MNTTTRKPYQDLGIGDTEHMGKVVGHSFVFTADTRQWQTAWPGGFGKDCPLRIGIVGETARMDMLAKQGFLESVASLTLTAPQLTSLAANPLRAAIQLEMAKVEQNGGAA